MFDICEVVVTASDPDWLSRVTGDLIKAGLIARGHLVPVRSMYLLEGELREEPEFRALLHTRRGNVTTIVITSTAT